MLHCHKRLASLGAFILSSTVFSYAQQAIPVDLMYGRPQISIPLFSVGEGALQAGVSLNYSTSGVQPDYMGGNAGVGWQLHGGGAVDRVLHGLPDDMGTSNGKSGWLYSTNASSVGSWTPSTENPSAIHEAVDWTALYGFSDKDTEPDEFIFNAPGLSGKFVFGNDGQPKVIPYQDLDIDITYDTTSIQSIVITNSLGVVYTFSVKTSKTREAKLSSGVTEAEYFKVEYDMYKEPITFTSSWKLLRIEGVAGEQINFSYDNITSAPFENDVVVIDPFGVSDSIYYFRDKTLNARLLSSIYTSNYSIDIGWAGSLLNNVIYTEFGASISREYELSYSYHKNNIDPTGASAAEKVPFLLSFRELLACSPQPGFEFKYQDVYVTESKSTTTTTLPFQKDDIGRDLWGYYNSASTSKVPKLFIDGSETMADRYRVVPISTQDTADLIGSDRSLNSLTVHDGALTSISYPTGITAAITYEPNSYYDSKADRDVLGEGIRVKETKFNGDGSELKTSYEYKLANNSSSGHVLYPVSMAFADFNQVVRLPDNSAPTAGVVYERVSVIQEGQGKTVYNFEVGPTYPDVSYGDWSPTRVRYAREFATSEDALGSSSSYELRNDYYQFPFPPNPNLETLRGHINSIQLYNESGNLISEQSYTYQENMANVDTVEAVRYETLTSLNNKKVYMYGKYKIITGMISNMVEEKSVTVSEMDNSDTITNIIAYTYNNNNLLKSTTRTNSDNTSYKTQYSYAGDYQFSSEPGNADSKGIYHLNQEHRQGTLIEVRQSANDGTNEIIGGSLTLYDNFGNYYLPSQILVSPGGTSFQISGTSQNELVYDTSYVLTSQIDQYVGHGAVATSSDDKHNVVGVHYGYDEQVPIVQIVGAAANEVIYAGFETTTAHDFNAGATTNNGWIGKAFEISSSSNITSDDFNKSYASYIVSCWINGTSASTISISISDGSSSVNTSLTYTSQNEWAYLEKEVDLSSLNDVGLTIQVTSNNDVTLDEFLFYPSKATIGITSIELMYGKIAESNGMGQSVFYSYDNKRRVKYIKNQNKDIIQYNEYMTYYDNTPKLNPGFKLSGSNEIIMGELVGFTAIGNCVDNVTYSWEAAYADSTGTKVVAATGSGVSFAFTPTLNKKYTVSLEVSHPTYDTEYSEKIIEPRQSFDFITKLNKNPLYSCDPYSNSRTVVALLTMGSDNLTDISYTWFYELDGGGWQQIQGVNNDTLVYSPNNAAYGTYTFKCTINADCHGAYNDGTNKNYSYELSKTVITSSFDYINDEPCK